MNKTLFGALSLSFLLAATAQADEASLPSVENVLLVSRSSILGCLVARRKLPCICSNGFRPSYRCMAP